MSDKLCFSNIKTQSFSIKSILTENECVIAFFKSLCNGPQNLSVTLNFLSLWSAPCSSGPQPDPQHRAPKVNQSDQTSTAPLHKVAPAHCSIP